jgi:hypothetical protein
MTDEKREVVVRIFYKLIYTIIPLDLFFVD